MLRYIADEGLAVPRHARLLEPRPRVGGLSRRARGAGAAHRRPARRPDDDGRRRAGRARRASSTPTCSASCSAASRTRRFSSPGRRRWRTPWPSRSATRASRGPRAERRFQRRPTCYNLHQIVQPTRAAPETPLRAEAPADTVVGAGAAEGAMDAGHAQAGARARRAAHDRRDHPRRVPQEHREGPRSPRFQPVFVSEPTVDETIEILMGRRTGTRRSTASGSRTRRSSPPRSSPTATSATASCPTRRST